MRLVLALILVFLAAACGGNETAGPDKTFQGDGYSFGYPGDWEERESDAEPGSADVVIAPEPGVTGISVGVFESPQEVTAENIDDLMGELRTGAETFLAQNVEGSTLDGDVEQVTVAGLPGIAFEGTTTAGQGIRTREAWVFDGTTFYAINCSSATGNEDSVDPACDQVLETFAVD